MNSRSFLALALCALAAVSLPAPAMAAKKDKKVEMEQLDRHYLRFASATRTFRGLIKCEVAKDEAAARRVFDYPLLSLGQDQAFKQFFGSGQTTTCLPGQVNRLRVSLLVGLGGTAEALLEKDGFAALEKQSAEMFPAGGGEFVWTWEKLTDEQDSDQVRVAHCLVGQYPTLAAAVLKTGETSNDERKLFNAMTAEIGQCIPAGERLTMHPMVLRPALAIWYHTAARYGQLPALGGSAA